MGDNFFTVGHRDNEVYGRRGSPAKRGGRWVSTPAIGLVTLALVIGACTSSSSKATRSGSESGPGGSAPKVAQQGGPGEGPYPWKYPASGTMAPGSGTTKAGTVCTAGTPQFDSPYAAPCIAKFVGDNGGATYNGVTATQILLAERAFPQTANSQQVLAQAKNAGAALPQVIAQVEQTFLDYFNSQYELYGRKVVLQRVPATGDATKEALGQGQDKACADADTIANQVHAFAEAGMPDPYVSPASEPFSKCAAQRKLVEFLGDAYYDESSYQQLNPYVWNIAQDCERISALNAEMIGKLFAGKPAQYAGDADLKTKVRKFGTYTPALPAFQHCSALASEVMTTKYHVPAEQQSTLFTYALDISTFQQSAQQAILKFKAAGVTTVILACDPFSAAMLTKSAASQNYHPEWLLNGAALNDLDQTAQTYDQSEVTGHLFGSSELSPSQETTGPDSPAGKLYQKLTGRSIPPGTDGFYGYLAHIFNALQAAGPNLTPENMARGIHALPSLGAPRYEYGNWNFDAGPSGTPGSGDHTAVSDSRLIYWDGKAPSALNHKQGTYVEVFPGKRFTFGNIPTDIPPLFPNG